MRLKYLCSQRLAKPQATINQFGCFGLKIFCDKQPPELSGTKTTNRLTPLSRPFFLSSKEQTRLNQSKWDNHKLASPGNTRMETILFIGQETTDEMWTKSTKI